MASRCDIVGWALVVSVGASCYTGSIPPSDAECQTDRDCADEETCDVGVCVEVCVDDRECDEEEICEDNRCVVGGPRAQNPSDVSASDGADAETTLTFTMPPGPFDLCAVRRSQDTFPADHTQGASVAEVQQEATTPVAITDTGLVNGTTYFYAVFCRNAQWWNDILDVTTPGVNADMAVPSGAGGPANPSDFSATDGEDARSVVSFTLPAAPVDECVVRRGTAFFPAGHSAGVAVGSSFTGPSTYQSVTDTSLDNGNTYYYAAFCRQGVVWNDTVDSAAPGVNADTATPLDPMSPDNPTDLVASDGEDSASTISFTMPAAPVSECRVRRATGGFPVGHAAGTDVGGAQVGAGLFKSVLDSGLSNGTTYYYAAFCRNQTSWNDSVDSDLPGVNADTGQPDASAPPSNPVDVVATDGEDAASTISFTMPAAPVTECGVRRGLNDYPVGHGGGTAVGVPQTGAGQAKTVSDTGLTNGNTYYYVVFCRNGDAWNDDVDEQLPGVNADTGQPLAATTIVVDGISTYSEQGDSTSLSFRHDVGSGTGRLLIVGLTFGESVWQTLPVVKYGTSVATAAEMTLVDRVDSDNTSAAMWYLIGPAQTGASNTYVYMDGFAAYGDAKIAAAISFFGVATATYSNRGSAMSGTGTAPAVTLASGDGELVVDVASTYNGTSMTPAVGQTEAWSLIEGLRMSGGSIKPGAATIDMSWAAMGASNWAVVAVSLAPN